MINRIDLFKISIFIFGWNGDCTRFEYQLREIERVTGR